MDVSVSTEDIGPQDRILNSIFANTKFDSLPDVEEADDGGVSLKMLKSVLKENLKNSDTLNVIKAHIRKDIIKGLSKRAGKEKDRDMNLKNRMLLSSIHHMLKARGMHGTLSIFMAESGLENNHNILNEVDIARLFKIHQLRASYLHVVTRPALVDTSTSTSSDLSLVEKPDVPPSLLDVMFDFCLLIQQECFKETACQTDVHGPTSREVLEQDLLGIRRSYLSKQQHASTTPMRSIEERMLAYQRECDERARRETDLQMQAFREFEVQKIRQEEKYRHQQDLQAYRSALDADYQQRLQAHLEREAHSARRLQEQERAGQQRLHEQRQQLQHQLEVAQQREEALQRKVQLEQEGLRSLEFRLKEASLTMQQREQQLARQEQTLFKQQSECMEIAKKEAAKQLESELRDAAESRKRLLFERTKIEEEKLVYFNYKTTLEQLREQISALESTSSLKDVEIASLKRAEEFIRSQLKAEEQHIARVLESIDPTLTTLSRSQQVMALIDHNAELMQKLDTLRDGQSLLQAYEDKDEELGLLRYNMKDSLERWEAEKAQLRKDLDEARSTQTKSRSDIQTMAQQVESMKGILQEKNALIDTLSRQQSSKPSEPTPSLTFAELIRNSSRYPGPSDVSRFTIFQPTGSSYAAHVPNAQHHIAATALQAAGRAPYTVQPSSADEELLAKLPVFQARPAYVDAYERNTAQTVYPSFVRPFTSAPPAAGLASSVWEYSQPGDNPSLADEEEKQREAEHQRRRMSVMQREQEIESMKAKREKGERERAERERREQQRIRDRERELEEEERRLRDEERALDVAAEREREMLRLREEERLRELERQKERVRELTKQREIDELKAKALGSERELDGLRQQDHVVATVGESEQVHIISERANKVESDRRHREQAQRQREEEEEDQRRLRQLREEEEDLERARRLRQLEDKEREQRRLQQQAEDARRREEADAREREWLQAQEEREQEREKARELEREQARARLRELEEERAREHDLAIQRERELDTERHQQQQQQQQQQLQKRLADEALAREQLQHERDQARDREDQERTRQLDEKSRREEAIRAEAEAEAARKQQEEDTERKRQEDDLADIAAARAKVLARKKQQAQNRGVVGSSQEEAMPQRSLSVEESDHPAAPAPVVAVVRAQPEQRPSVLIFGSTADESHDMEVNDSSSDSGTGFRF